MGCWGPWARVWGWVVCLFSAMGERWWWGSYPYIDRCMGRSERVDLVSARGFLLELEHSENLSRVLGVQPAARLRWNRCLSFGGTLFRAELLGRVCARVLLSNCVIEGEVGDKEGK